MTKQHGVMAYKTLFFIRKTLKISNHETVNSQQTLIPSRRPDIRDLKLLTLKKEFETFYLLLLFIIIL